MDKEGAKIVGDQFGLSLFLVLGKTSVLFQK